MFSIRRFFIQALPAYVHHLPQARFSAAKAKKQSMSSQFSELNTPEGEKPVAQTTGRAWKAIELRLKSNEDLHKLWYVCLKEKNLLLADKVLHDRYNRMFHNKHRMYKVALTMRRILVVMKERQKVRNDYRRELEAEYVEKKKREMEAQAKKQNIAQVPDIDWRLMKDKLRDLRRGIDNTSYLEKHQKWNEEKQLRKEQLRQQFSKPVPEFSSFFEKELQAGGKLKPSQQEILRSHIKNWRQLSFKHRRIVMGFLNARRAQDARSAFLSELKMLGQKIASEQPQGQPSQGQPSS